MLATLPQGDEVFVADGYIRVFQDVRGKYGSEGDYVMTRPLRGPLNATERRSLDRRLRHHRLAGEERARIERPGGHDRQLVRRLHRRDGAGQSAPGAEGRGADEPDGRRLDGRRLVPLRRVPPGQPRLLHRARRRRRARATAIVARRATTTTRTSGAPARPATSRKAAGLDQLPWWRKIIEHPAYDAFWQEQALDRTMAAQPLTVPTMWIQGLWDQEDMWGAIHCYLAVEPKDTAQRHELPGDGAVAPQPGELRRRHARAAASGTATPRCSSAATC